ncbi:adenosylcobinamide amidohydrolase [Gephyromycinifex aptenodytis]|uniref:adenosylcobinamide amidohydrolase n=1 Tax=Gephyromycinifex aptenodytis TaxID=2716227 RepID=UPI001447FFFA|nr:adenosylcobinamide amidohydrolase [Gephyromycinifex aptenodytis]
MSEVLAVPLLDQPGLVSVHADAMAIVARFAEPHRVLISSPLGGGMREDLTAVYNHQSCEPAGHGSRVMRYLGAHEVQEHERICAERELDPERTAGLGTAASMRCAGVATREFRDLQVAAVSTAGVEGNAGRAGDPAGSYEWQGRYEPSGEPPQPSHGTINTLLFINHELVPGALVRALITATEAKSAALGDLVVGSRYSPGRATGTGTDQSALCCPIGGGAPLRSAGHHVVLGRLISEAVGASVRSALVLQNGMEPSSRRSVSAQLARYGVSMEGIIETARALLSREDADLLAVNVRGLDADPRIVAAAAGMAEVADQIRAGILPTDSAGDHLRWAATLIALAASGDRADVRALRARLDSCEADVAVLIPTAICLGHVEKWRDLHQACASLSD